MTRVQVLVGLALPIAAVALGGSLDVARPAQPAGPPAAQAMHAAVEGFGAGTRGGAGQPDCVVSSLDDAGPRTLRTCLAGGHRHVKFAVAGTIVLASQLSVQGPFVTIDGFSAPSPGITLRGWGLDIFGRNGAHDVVVRGLRIRDAGLSTLSPRGKSSTDCIGVNGPGAFNIVIEHVSIHHCADGGIDISSGPRNVTIQWSLVSTGKAMLWGSTRGSAHRDTRRISMHHTMLICGHPLGCDRFPLVRAGGHVVTADLRNNVFEGWIRANGTKIEPAAWVNVVGNAYIPRPESSFAHRAASLAVKPGARVFAAGNLELGAPPRPDLNDNGNEASPLPAPPITPRELGCVVRHAGMHPRDAVDERLLTFVARLPTACPEPDLPAPADEQPPDAAESPR
jgi:pectate lyase